MSQPSSGKSDNSSFAGDRGRTTAPVFVAASDAVTQQELRGTLRPVGSDVSTMSYPDRDEDGRTAFDVGCVELV